MGVGDCVGILANDDMAFFQSQQPLRLDTERPDIMRATGLHECIPQRLTESRRHVNLEAELSDEADTD